MGTRKHISLTIDSELLAEIERLRGLAKRSTFIEHILRIGLEACNKHNKGDVPGKTSTFFSNSSLPRPLNIGSRDSSAADQVKRRLRQ